MIQTLTLVPGDHVVYPKHGPGVVRAVTQRSVGGEDRHYYEIVLHTGGMQMLVPVEKAAALGLRRVLTEDEVPDLLAVITREDLSLPEAFQPRYRLEQTILETGNIVQVAHLAATLTRRHLQRGLAASELSVLAQAKKTVAAELAVSLNVSEVEAARLFDEKLA